MAKKPAMLAESTTGRASAKLICQKWANATKDMEVAGVAGVAVVGAVAECSGCSMDAIFWPLSFAPSSFSGSEGCALFRAPYVNQYPAGLGARRYLVQYPSLGVHLYVFH